MTVLGVGHTISEHDDIAAAWRGKSNSQKFKTGIISCVYYNKNMSSAEALSCSKTLL